MQYEYDVTQTSLCIQCNFMHLKNNKTVEKTHTNERTNVSGEWRKNPYFSIQPLCSAKSLLFFYSYPILYYFIHGRKRGTFFPVFFNSSATHSLTRTTCNIIFIADNLSRSVQSCHSDISHDSFWHTTQHTQIQRLAERESENRIEFRVYQWKRKGERQRIERITNRVLYSIFF